MKTDVAVLYLTRTAISQNLTIGLMIVILIPFIIFKQFVFHICFTSCFFFLICTDYVFNQYLCSYMGFCLTLFIIINYIDVISVPDLCCCLWDVVPWLEIEPRPLQWECRVLATVPPGKSLDTVSEVWH